MTSRFLLTATAMVLFSSCMIIDEFGEVQYATFDSKEASKGEQRLEARVELGVGEVVIQPGTTDQAYELDLHYNELAFKPEVEYHVDSQGTGHLKVGLKGDQNVRRAGKNEMNLRLNPDAVLDLEASLGVGESSVDLSGMKVESLKVESGVGQTEISMLAPNPIRCRRLVLESGVGAIEVKGLGNFNFEDFEFDGGVGGASLDFSGEWAVAGEVSISVGVGGVEIELPREIGAEIRASKSFLSGMNFSGFDKKGSVYRSRNIEKVDKIVKIRINAGIGGVDVHWR